MATKHWAEDSIKRTIPLAGIPGEKIEYKPAVSSKDEIKATRVANSVKIKAEQDRRTSQMDMFDNTNMTKESIAEMNAFLNEKVKSFGTHPDDEKEEAEDVKLVKKMVKKPALKDDVSEALNLSGLKKGALHKDLGVPKDEKIPAKKLAVTSNDSPLEVKRKTFASNAKKWHHESVMESFNVDKLSFVQTSPITSSLAEAIAMVMETKEEEQDAHSAAKYHRTMDQYHFDKIMSETDPDKIAKHTHASNMHKLASSANLEAAFPRGKYQNYSDESVHKTQSRMADAATKATE